MSRGMLDDPSMESIEERLPNIAELDKQVLALNPNVISMVFPPESTVPGAAACLQDAMMTLAEARYAMEEALAHRIWYMEKTKPENEKAAVFFSRFYIDDTALRLYSGEHLAEAIIAMFEVSNDEIGKYQGTRTSRQVAICKYLKKEKADHPVTSAICSLGKSEAWTETFNYRNEWVHRQRRLVEGLGIQYKRGPRWNPQPSGKGHGLRIGGGDRAELSIDDLFDFVRPALFDFVAACSDVVQAYIELLTASGRIRINPRGGLTIHS